MTIGSYIQTIFCYLIPAFFLWISRDMIVDANFGEKPAERQGDYSLFRMKGTKRFIYDYRVCYHVLLLIRNICRIFFAGWMLNALLLSRIYEDTYVFRRIMDIGQGVSGFIGIDVALISFYIVDSETTRTMKKEYDEDQYRKEYMRAKDAFNKTNRPKRKRALLYRMEKSIALLIDYNARMIENGKLERADELDQLFPQLERIERQFLKLGNIKSKYEIRWYTQCLWCCVTLPKQRFEEAKQYQRIDASRCWDEMTNELAAVGEELYDSLIAATDVGYVSLPQRENMYKAYHLYVQMMQELQELFPQETQKTDYELFKKDEEMYADMLKDREENLWNQENDTKE